MSALSAARLAVVNANGEALKALDLARVEVAGGRDRVSRDLLGAVGRLQSASTHVVAVVLLTLVEERAVKG